MEKLIVLHPLFINLWMRLADVIYLKINADSSAKIVNQHNKNAFINHYSVCYLTISELIRHGYQFRSEIVSKQKHKQKLWVSSLFFLFVFFSHIKYLIFSSSTNISPIKKKTTSEQKYKYFHQLFKTIKKEKHNFFLLSSKNKHKIAMKKKKKIKKYFFYSFI